MFHQHLGGQPAKHVETVNVIDISTTCGNGNGNGGRESGKSSPNSRSKVRGWKRALAQLIIDRTGLAEVRWIRIAEASRHLHEEANVMEDVELRFPQ